MRRGVIIVLALVVVVAAAIGVGRYLAAESDGTELVLREVTGSVELSVAGKGAAEATAGTVLSENDTVNTGSEGRAVLGLDGGTRIRIGPSSSVVVKTIDEDGVGLVLEDGALEATVIPEDGALSVSGGTVDVQATDAEFAIGVSEGVSLVETVRGEVALMGVDQSRLSEGNRAVIRDRTATIGPIPEELLLAVTWPDQARTRAETTEVRGRTAPGAEVVVSGAFGSKSIRADETGSFVAEVPLTEGANEVTVRARDLVNRDAAEEEGVLETRVTQGPTFRGGVEYGN